MTTLPPYNYIRWKRLHPRAVLPSREPGNAAYDLVIPEETVLEPWEPTLVDLGFSTEFSSHLWANIRSRSSSMPKKRILVTHGVVDSSYRGPWKLSLLYLPEMNLTFPLRLGEAVGSWSWEPLVLEAGSRVAQVVFEVIPPTVWEEVDGDLEESARGARGFGESTGL